MFSTAPKIVIAMIGAVLFWSLYPLVVSYGLNDNGNWTFLLAVMIASFVGSSLYAAFYLLKNRKVGEFIQLHKNFTRHTYAMMLLAGVSGFLCNSFFFWALDLANKAGVSILMESWPIMALIATPFLMRKSWSEVSFKEFVVSIIALAGCIIVVLSDQQISFSFFGSDLSEDVDYSVLGGYVLALAGGYMVALNAVSQGAVSEYLEPLGNSFAASVINQVYYRFISIVFAFVFYLYLSGDENFDIGANVGEIIFVGVGVLVIGTSLYTYCLLKSASPTIHIFYYFVPVLAVIWLWLAGETAVGYGLIVGGLIILASNVYLSLMARRKPKPLSEPS